MVSGKERKDSPDKDLREGANAGREVRSVGDDKPAWIQAFGETIVSSFNKGVKETFAPLNEKLDRTLDKDQPAKLRSRYERPARKQSRDDTQTAADQNTIISFPKWALKSTRVWHADKCKYVEEFVCWKCDHHSSNKTSVQVHQKGCKGIPKTGRSWQTFCAHLRKNLTTKDTLCRKF